MTGMEHYKHMPQTRQEYSLTSNVCPKSEPVMLMVLLVEPAILPLSLIFSILRES